MRLLLEGEAAARFATAASAADAFRLDHLNRQLAAAYGADDADAVIRAVQAWGLTLAAGAHSPLFEATIVNLRLRAAPHITQALRTSAPEDRAFIAFTVHVQDELVLAVRGREAERARVLRQADLITFQRYLYRRLGWTAPDDLPRSS